MARVHLKAIEAVARLARSFARRAPFSREESVHEPTRRGCLASVEAFAVEPEAAGFLILNEVISPRRLWLALAPPFGSDALRPLRERDPMHLAAPAEASRRALRHQGQDLRGVGAPQEERGTKPRARGPRPGERRIGRGAASLCLASLCLASRYLASLYPANLGLLGQMALDRVEPPHSARAEPLPKPAVSGG